jgi:hypothetical protein
MNEQSSATASARDSEQVAELKQVVFQLDLSFVLSCVNYNRVTALYLIIIELNQSRTTLSGVTFDS